MNNSRLTETNSETGKARGMCLACGRELGWYDTKVWLKSKPEVMLCVSHMARVIEEPSWQQSWDFFSDG